MLKQSAVLFVICLLAALSGGCAIAQSQSVAASQPHSWIDAPLDGSALPLAPVQVISHSTDLFSIVQVELSVNGQVIQTQANTNPTQNLVLVTETWSPNAPGNYTLRVRAMNSISVWGEIAQAVVTIGLQTPTPTATRTATATPTVSPSPVPSLPPATISFVADPNTITAGRCSTLRWQVTNASRVLLDNAPVNPNGSKEECPNQARSYTLRVITLDNQTVERTVTINVVAPTRTHTPTPTIRFLVTIPPIFIPTDTPTRPPPR